MTLNFQILESKKIYKNMLFWLVYMGFIALTTGLGAQFRISRSAKVLGAQWQGFVHGSFTRLYAR